MFRGSNAPIAQWGGAHGASVYRDCLTDTFRDECCFCLFALYAGSLGLFCWQPSLRLPRTFKMVKDKIGRPPME